MVNLQYQQQINPFHVIIGRPKDIDMIAMYQISDRESQLSNRKTKEQAISTAELNSIWDGT